MNVTKVSGLLGNVVEMLSAPTRPAVIRVLANLVTLVIPMSIVMTLMNVEMILVRIVEEKPDAKMSPALLNAHVLMGPPLTPSQNDAGVPWHALLTGNVLAMPSVPVDHVLVLNQMWDPIVKIFVIQPLVFQMLNVLFKTIVQCVDACLDSNCYPSKELVSVSFFLKIAN